MDKQLEKGKWGPRKMGIHKKRSKTIDIKPMKCRDLEKPVIEKVLTEVNNRYMQYVGYCKSHNTLRKAILERTIEEQRAKVQLRYK